MRDMIDIGQMIAESYANRRIHERVTAAMEQVAQEIGIPPEAINGVNDAHTVIQVWVDFDRLNGEIHRMAYIPDGTKLGIVDCYYSNGTASNYGLNRRQWKPPVHVSDAEIAASLARLVAEYRAAWKDNEVSDRDYWQL